MHVSRHSLLLWVFLAAIIFSPVLVGAFPYFSAALIAGTLFVFAIYAFSRVRMRLPKRIALVIVSACFAVTLFDLSARPILHYLSRPAERFIYRWPPLPQLQRYVACVHFEGTTYGDLAAVSGRRDLREERRVKFVTDEYGFRNEPLAAEAEKDARPLDVIVLGDSFGVAAGTSQENTLSSRLARDYGLSVYNLSISRENPQQERANLLLEGPRLKTREGTCVLWLIFPGNDLDEPYYAELENPQPRWPGLFARLSNGFSDFRSRSSVNQLLSRGGSELVIERKFIDDGRHLLFFAPYAQRGRRTAEEVRRHPNFESLKATLGSMERLAIARHLTVAVALVPSKEEIYSWVLDGAPPWSTAEQRSGFSNVLRELCEQHGFRFLDLKPSLVEASRQTYEKSGALLWWRDDTHWNGEGQRVAAAAVYDHLLHGIQTR